MKTKRFSAILLVVSFLLVVSSFFVGNAGAQSTVIATVTVQNIALSVTDGTIAYGIIPANTSRSTCTTEANELQTVTNTGNVSATFNIRGTNSANWTLAATPGADQYVHRYLNTTCSTFSGGTPLTLTNQNLATSVAPLGTTPLNLQVTAPNPSTVFTAQNVDVIVQATL